MINILIAHGDHILIMLIILILFFVVSYYWNRYVFDVENQSKQAAYTNRLLEEIIKIQGGENTQEIRDQIFTEKNNRREADSSQKPKP